MSLARIATVLGLSVTTVSRALGGYQDVAAATRARVAVEAARINYAPNRTAQRLQSGRPGTVGVVLPAAPGQSDDPFFLRMLMAFGAVLERAGLDMIVTSVRAGPGELEAFQRLIASRRVDGMLIARTRCHDGRIGAMIDGGMPFVTHGRSLETRPYAWVDIDGEAAFRAATERLIAFGHRRIGLINADPVYMFARHRRAGWAAALRTAGLRCGPVREAEPSVENGFLLAREMLAAPGRPTALLCATDRLAAGALHAIDAGGLQAGRDVSIIGYDDLPLASYTSPPLTSVAQPVEQAAERMVGMLRQLLAGASPAGMQAVLPAQLITRSSDGPVHANPNRGTARSGLPRQNRGASIDVQEPSPKQL